MTATLVRMLLLVPMVAFEGSALVEIQSSVRFPYAEHRHSMISDNPAITGLPGHQFTR